MHMVNTHYYDQKVDDVIASLSSDISRVSKITLDEKRNRGKSIISYFQKEVGKPTNKSLSPIALNTLYVLVNSIGTPGNYDPINKLSADDLLMLCFEKIETDADLPDDKKSDFLPLFIAQLEEMQTGMCPQGRTQRMLQILRIFILKADVTE